MKLTLRDLLNIIFRFKRGLLIFWAVILLTVTTYYTQSVRSYSSNARILVSLGTENEGRHDYFSDNNLQLMQREQQIHNEQQILLSDHVLLTTAKWILGEPTPGDTPPPMGPEVEEARVYLLGEAPEPTALLRVIHSAGKGAKSLMRRLSAGSQKDSLPDSTRVATMLSKSLDANTIFNSDALDVSFRYRDPAVAQTILKLVLAAYMDHHIAVFQSAGEPDLLKNELDRSVTEYQTRLVEMSKYMTAHHLFTEETQVNSLIEQRRQLDQSLSEAAADRQAATARMQLFTELNASLKRYETYSTVEAHNKLHDELVSRLNEALVQERQILNSHPASSQFHEDEAAILQRIRELLATEPPQVVDQKEERRSGASELAEQQLITATAAQHAAEARITQLKLELNRVDRSLDGYTKDLPGYDMIRLNLDFSKQQSEQMGKAYVSSRLRILTAQNEITDVSIIDQPSWNPEPVSPKKSIIGMLTMALLGFGGIAVVMAGLLLDPTVSDLHSLETTLKVPVAAVFPLLPSDHGDLPRLLDERTERDFVRIYTGLRHHSKPGVIILLTGSNGGEGVSLIGYELARFLGRHSASRTALLDCTPHGLRSNAAADGPFLLSLTDAQAEETVLRVSEPQQSPLKLMEAWRQQFDFIVIASSIVGQVYRLTDIFPLVNAAFVVVEAGRTRHATASSTLELLRSYGVKELKLILNKRVLYVPEWLMRGI